MKRVFSFLSDNLLLLITLSFLVFIPLYPKLPLFDIKHTWVYIRIEDLIMAIVWGAFFLQLWRKKATLKTPLTYPILIFWIIGAVATLHGVLFLFPNLQGVFPQLAFLYWLRHVEYLSVFFLGFAAMRKKSFVTPVVFVLAATLITVVLYGLGQRYLGFPAFLTMNEEFAKGIPLRLSALARIPSTFAGHYDLAAYLALMIPVMGSMVIGFKQWWAKVFFFLTALSGVILLLMTASRVSFGVYLVSITVLLIMQKRKKFIAPVLIGSFILLQAFPGLSSRFASTFQQVDLVVDSRSGRAIGVASEFGNGEIVIEDEQSTGENLPGGSKYISVPTSSDEGETTRIVYKKLTPGTGEPQIISMSGEVIVKKAFAYDVSFTTRFQGEWPRAIDALERNYVLGSGYSSINLATDNNYLRILGEIGLLGFASFIVIFLLALLYLQKTLPLITDARTRALVLGVIAGVLGVSLNAILIDVFEASKLAFVLWCVLGITIGLASLYQKGSIKYQEELQRIFTHPLAFIMYLIGVGSLVYSRFVSNYFVADDFTWLRWAADCQTRITHTCDAFLPTIQSFFLNAQGFYFRPGIKSFFYIVYPVFEIFPTPYHVVSLLFHIASAVLIYLISRKWLNHDVFAFAVATLFLVLSIHFEAVLWISSLGHIIGSVCILFALFLYVYSKEYRRRTFLLLGFVSLLVATFFHEFAVIGPLLIIAIDLLLRERENLTTAMSRRWYTIYLSVIPLYYLLRTNAQSLTFAGDYRYSIENLPFNLIGNSISYIFLIIFGPSVLEPLQNLRFVASGNALLAGFIGIALLVLAGILMKRCKKQLFHRKNRFLLISVVICIIPLLPFLGLGNIAARYTYLASFGVIFCCALILKNIYETYHMRHKKIIAGIYVVSFVILLLLNVIVLGNVAKHWQKAGDIVNNTLVNVTLSVTQEGKPKLKNPTFYFINLPIRYGTAWIFPVGLHDAMWFAYRGTGLTLVTTDDEIGSQKKADADTNVKVFKFLEDYTLVEYTPPLVPIVTPKL